MNTFLPYRSFIKSLRCLDDRRLGKQRPEAATILKVNEQGPNIAFIWNNSQDRPNKTLLWHQSLDSGDGIINTPWYNHPATGMWRGLEESLERYKNMAIIMWELRGFNNNMQCTFVYQSILDKITKPSWLTEEFCTAHRSNLLRKDNGKLRMGGLPYSYKELGWTESDNLPYIWPES